MCQASKVALARDVNRLSPSLAMFLSFFLLGVFVSALGPAVPALSRDVGTQEVSFGMVFSLRGFGHLLGSWSSSLRQAMRLIYIILKRQPIDNTSAPLVAQVLSQTREEGAKATNGVLYINKEGGRHRR